MSTKRARWLLVPAIIAVAWSAPLVRLAEGVPPLAIAFWRTFAATVVIAPFALVRGRADPPSRKQVKMMVLSGAALAIHFASWIASVRLTSIASSVLLVVSAPVFVALGTTLLGRAPARRVWLGIAIATTGAAVIAGSDLNVGGGLKGDGLAVVGAIAAAIYLLIGRGSRRHVSLLTYAGIVYGSCAALLGVTMLLTGTPFTGYSSKQFLLVAAIAIGPQLIGHTTFNFVLDRLDAVEVAVAIMAEPIGATLIAFALFGELPGILVVPGGLLLLAGILVSIRASKGSV
ncbi:MAG TPA: DMT family transporter [Actinomycetota bacterium]|nr:DMT family transporter [Actinomycetota bacterium]